MVVEPAFCSGMSLKIDWQSQGHLTHCRIVISPCPYLREVPKSPTLRPFALAEGLDANDDKLVRVDHDLTLRSFG